MLSSMFGSGKDLETCHCRRPEPGLQTWYTGSTPVGAFSQHEPKSRDVQAFARSRCPLGRTARIRYRPRASARNWPAYGPRPQYLGAVNIKAGETLLVGNGCDLRVIDGVPDRFKPYGRHDAQASNRPTRCPTLVRPSRDSRNLNCRIIARARTKAHALQRK
jgi:hypothetical protein